MNVPGMLTAGDTWSWTETLRDYPASAGWVLTIYASQGAVAPRAITGTASGDAHALDVTATASGAWPAGEYHWVARVSKAGEFHTVAQGTLRVLPDPTTAVDRRTWAERCLAAVETLLLDRSGKSIIESEVDRALKLKHATHDELIKLRSRFRSEVRRERGGPVARVIPVRFGHV